MPRGFKPAMPAPKMQKYDVDKVKRLAVFGSMEQGFIHTPTIEFPKITKTAAKYIELLKGTNYYF